MSAPPGGNRLQLCSSCCFSSDIQRGCGGNLNTDLVRSAGQRFDAYLYTAREWQQMKEAAEAGVSVVAIANPGSGPGTEGDRSSYEKGMEALRNGGVEVIGYVASGYGTRSEGEVKADIDRYKEWYGRWLSGIFVDESVGVADDNDGDRAMCSRYKGYREHVQKQLGESATVVMNSGMMQTEAALTNDVGAGVVWNVLENNRAAMEKDFGSVAKTFTVVKKKEAKKGGGWKVWKSLGGGGGDKKKRRGPPVVGTPPAAPDQLKGRAAFMVHGCTVESYEEMCHWVNQLREGGWTHVYMTDKVFDPASDNPALHNPWDAVPSYWEDLVKAMVEVCGRCAASMPPAGDSSTTSKPAVCC
ncbi:unnamed protein product [Pylaiella littoralis]